MTPEAAEWFKQAEYDFGTARAMYRARRYIYAAYMCHLAVEKALKAIFVEKTGQIPPKTHNLNYLFRLVQVELPEKQKEFLGVLNLAGVSSRYPEDLEQAFKNYPRKVVKDYLRQGRAVIQWLKKICC